MAFRRSDWQLAAFVICVFVLVFLVFLLRSVLFPFIVGFTLAYILLPLVKRGEKWLPRLPGARRVAVIAVIYCIIIAVLTIFFILTFLSLQDAVTTFVNNSPQYWESLYQKLSGYLSGLTGILLRRFPQLSQEQVDQYLYNIGLNALNAFTSNITLSNILLSFSAISTVLGVFIMPIFVFYLLKDWEKIGHQIRSAVPASVLVHAERTGAIVDLVMGRFLRAQLLLGLFIGLVTLAGLLILRIPFAPLLAVIAGFGEMVPFVGPWIAIIVAAFITLALDPGRILWVLALYGGVQLLENLLLVPRVRGGFLNIHPAFALVLLVLGTYLAGVWGAIFILPAAATLARIYSYVKTATGQETEKVLSDKNPKSKFRNPK